MYKVVESKFIQNDKLMNKLIKTYPKMLIEGNTWGDKYWGCVVEDSDNFLHRKSLIGENKLGIILMDIREKYTNDKKGFEK